MDKIFAEGLILKSIETQYGELQKLSVKTDEFKKFLDTHDKNGWVNLNIKKSREGKPYIELDSWQPNSNESKSNNNLSVEDVPF